MEQLLQSFALILAQRYLAISIQGSFATGLVPLAHEAYDLYNVGIQQDNEAMQTEAMRAVDQIRKLCAFTVTLKADGSAAIKRNTNVGLGFYERSATSFLVFVDNPGGGPAELDLVAETDGFQCELPYKLAIKEGIFFRYAVGFIRSPEAGRWDELGLRLTGATGDATVVMRDIEVERLHEVQLDIQDEAGDDVTAAIVFRDRFGTPMPAGPDRLGQDFAFEEQIYRTSGQSVSLPAGEIEMIVSHGPEYQIERRTVTITADAPNKVAIKLRRWVDLEQMGLYSGDVHVHAHGGRYVRRGATGVTPAELYPHLTGEDLNFNHVLNLAVGDYEHQREFFSAEPDPLSSGRHWMKYDIEISGRGFGGHHLGHAVLLNGSQSLE